MKLVTTGTGFTEDTELLLYRPLRAASIALLMGWSSWEMMVSTTAEVSTPSLLPWGAAVASPAQARRQIIYNNNDL